MSRATPVSYTHLEALKSVPADKLIAGVPFYTRLWFERPKTDEEFAADEGTEAEKMCIRDRLDGFSLSTIF